MSVVPAMVRPLGRAVFWLALLVYLTSADGSLTTTDGVVTFDVTRNLVEHGSIAMSGNVLGMSWHQGRDGKFYAPFGVGQSIANVPPYVAAKTFMWATGVRLGKPDTLLKAAVAMSQTIVVASIVWMTFMWGVLVTRAPRASALGAITLAFASVLWPYAGFGFNQPLAALTLSLALYNAVVGTIDDDRGRLGRAGWWMAASLLTRHEMALGVVPLLVWLLSAPRGAITRSARVVTFLPGLAVGVAAWMALNWWRFGTVLDTGYLHDPVPGIGNSPVVEGLAGLLFSPSTSIFLYSPFVAFGLAGLLAMTRSADRSIGWLLVAEVVVFTMFYATLDNWTGGRSYGSRYLLVVVPLLAIGWSWALARISRTSRYRLFAIVFAVGFVVQWPGVLVDYAKVSQAAGRAYTTAERRWSVEYAPIVANTRDLIRAVPENIAYVTGRRPVPPVPAAAGADDRGFSQQFVFSLDLWWLYLFYVGVLPRLWMFAIVAAAAAAIGIALRAVRLRGLEFDA